MTAGELKGRISAGLERAGIDSAAFEAALITGHVLGTSAFYSGREVTDEQERAVGEIVRRRLAREPLQYILGEWEFYGLPFKVGPGVLIPRPDTEILVQRAVSLLKGRKEAAVYDLCAGTGCIGVAIAKHTGARVVCVEKSAEAFGYLTKNIKLNKAEVRAVRGDVLECPSDGLRETADMIVCNPPYIKGSALPGLERELSYEPVSALYGGDDGLMFYRFIAKYWKKVLKPGGYMLFEIGCDQLGQVSDIMNGEGFSGVSHEKDYGGNDRVVYGARP